MKEIWKDIKEYEKLYQVSNFGRVKSIRKNKILKQKYNSNGYLYVGLYKKNKQKQYLIHRLVAQTFIPNPLHKPFVNHIDFNRKNNKVENLNKLSEDKNGTIMRLEYELEEARKQIARYEKLIDMIGIDYDNNR